MPKEKQRKSEIFQWKSEGKVEASKNSGKKVEISREK